MHCLYEKNSDIASALILFSFQFWEKRMLSKMCICGMKRM